MLVIEVVSGMGFPPDDHCSALYVEMQVGCAFQVFQHHLEGVVFVDCSAEVETFQLRIGIEYFEIIPAL